MVSGRKVRKSIGVFGGWVTEKVVVVDPGSGELDRKKAIKDYGDYEDSYVFLGLAPAMLALGTGTDGRWSSVISTGLAVIFWLIFLWYYQHRPPRRTVPGVLARDLLARQWEASCHPDVAGQVHHIVWELSAPATAAMDEAAISQAFWMRLQAARG